MALTSTEPPSVIPVEKNSDEGPCTVRIHSKCIASPQQLVTLLQKHIGTGNYTVEMRHNIYTIVVKRPLDAGQFNPQLFLTGRQPTLGGPIALREDEMR